jgi:hypothetical protein
MPKRGGAGWLDATGRDGSAAELGDAGEEGEGAGGQGPRTSERGERR